MEFRLHTTVPGWNDLHCCSAPLSGNMGMFQCGYTAHCCVKHPGHNFNRNGHKIMYYMYGTGDDKP